MHSTAPFDQSDPAAREFVETALEHYPSVFRVARFLARETSVAEDLTQEVFLRAWSSFQRFQRDMSCRAWLIGILYNVWSHERRRRVHTPVVFNSDAAAANVLLYTPPIPEKLTDEEMLAAFESLPLEMQEVLRLADLEALKYREIAALLEIPLGTVMSRLNRARHRLREALAAQRSDGESCDFTDAAKSPRVRTLRGRS